MSKIKELGKYIGEEVYYDGKTGAVGLRRLGPGIYILDYLCLSDNDVGILFPKFREPPKEYEQDPEIPIYSTNWDCCPESITICGEWKSRDNVLAYTRFDFFNEGSKSDENN